MVAINEPNMRFWGGDVGTPSHRKPRVLNIFEICKKQTRVDCIYFWFLQSSGDSVTSPICEREKHEKMTRVLRYMSTMLADGTFKY